MLAKFDGTKLHEVREQQDMSQAELAARAGTPPSVMSVPLKKEKSAIPPHNYFANWRLH